jgi:hypothetical protein
MMEKFIMSNAWIAKVFPSAPARGLSGGCVGEAIGLNMINPAYNYRHRKHTASEDIATSPDALWLATGADGRHGGLQAHFTESITSSVLTFTDVLVVISRADAAAGLQRGHRWKSETQEYLEEHIHRDFIERGVRPRFSGREVLVRIIEDGSDVMEADDYGLGLGEFVTILAENVSVELSDSVADVFLSMGAGVNGYTKVCALAQDQISTTIGSCWLDNYSNLKLEQPSLLRLLRLNNGDLVLVLNPDLQDQYALNIRMEQGVRVTSVLYADGKTLCSVVLVSPQISHPSLVLLPEMANKETLVAKDLGQRVLVLQECGLLLQKVHFNDFMDGYDVYIGRGGQLGCSLEDPAATVQVRDDGVSLLSHSDTVLVMGDVLPTGRRILLSGDVGINVGDKCVDYIDLRLRTGGKWPYLGEIRRAPVSCTLPYGDTYRIGRGPRCDVLLPDKPTNQNILWLAGVGDESVIRSKRGDIEKSRFYTDSIMVATEHALLNLEGESPRFQNTAKACSSFIRRAGAWMDLGATSSMATPDKEGVQLENGDELLVGNSIFRVVLSIDVEPIEELKQEPSEELAPVVPPPLPEPPKEDTASTLMQGSLFESVSEEPASGPVAIKGEGIDIDHPDAAPKPLFLKEVGFDSIIMDVRDLDTNSDGTEKEDDDSSL